MSHGMCCTVHRLDSAAFGCHILASLGPWGSEPLFDPPLDIEKPRKETLPMPNDLRSHREIVSYPAA